MNRVDFMAQANQMLGNNIMNPRQHKWIDKPLDDPSGLACLKFLTKQVFFTFEGKILHRKKFLCMLLIVQIKYVNKKD